MARLKTADRLSVIENELAALKAQAAGSLQSHPIHAIEAIHGGFENDEAFKEAMRLGRAWRRADRRKLPKLKARRK